MRNSAGSKWWRRSLTAAGLVATLWAAPASAQETRGEVAEKASSKREHRVRKGDTLWDLARYYLNDPFLWGLIYESNRGVVANPHLIYPNDRLVIPELVPGRGASIGFAVADAVRPAGPPRRTLFYRGGAAAAAEDGGEPAGSVPTLLPGDEVEVAVVQPGEYLSAPWLTDGDAPRPLGTVLRVIGHGAPGDKIAASVHPGDRVYVQRRGSAAPEVGVEILLARAERRVRGWGRVVSPSAIGVVEAVERDLLVVSIDRQFGLVRPGDIALPLGSLPVVEGKPQPVQDGARGRIVAFAAEKQVYSTSDLAFIDLGARTGVGVGDVLEAYLPERMTGGWQQLVVPEERVARLRVIRVEERTATAQLIEISQAAVQVGLPVRVVAKMP